jgi:hypothetical protein
LIEPQKILKKTRYNVTPNYNSLTDFIGNSTTIRVDDGSVKTVMKLQVIPITTKIKEAKIMGSRAH